MGFRAAYRFALAAALLGHSAAFASSGGITGVSGSPGDGFATCSGCHGGGAQTGTASIGGPTSVTPGVSTGGFSVNLTSSNATAAGYNLSATAGTLSPGAGSQALGGQLTHTAKQFLSGSAASWAFSWSAPSAVGTQTMYVCVNRVNNDSATTGDSPICTSRNVTVNTAPTAVNDSTSVSEDSLNTCISVLTNDTSGASGNESGDSISLFSVGVPSQGGSVAVGGGACTANQARYSPAANFAGSETFTYTIRDSFNSASFQDTATVTVTVNAVNDAPSTGNTFNVAASYTENAAAVTIDNAITITDVDSANLNQATVSITGNFASAEDSLVCPSPAIPGISCSYSSGTGVLTLSGSATLANYELAIEDVGYLNSSDAPSTATRTVSLVVRDTGNTSSTADTTTVAITATNDAPVAVDDSATVDEDSSLNVLSVLGNDTDVDSGDTKTVTLVNGGPVSTCPTMTAVTNGSVCKSNASPNNTLSFTPTPAFVGATSFTYTMADTAAATDTATVNLTIANVGDAPVAVDDTATVNEDSTGNTLNVLLNDTDVDAGDTKTITQVNGAAVATCPSTTAVTNGTVCKSSSSPDNTLSFTPTANVAGSSSFSYTVTDSAALTDTGSVTITISNVADTPVAAADSQTIAEDALATTVNVLANDTDADQTSGPGDTRQIISVGATSAGGQVSIVGEGVNNTLSYDSAPDFFGTETFSYTMQDSTGLQSSATVTMTVTAVNDAPQITSTAVTTGADGQPYSYQVAVSDVDDLNNGVQLAWSLPTAPAGMTVSSTGLIQWTPPVNVVAGYNVTVQVADGGENGAAPATQSFTINVSVPDSDSDGMPDSFENQYGFDPNDASDADADADGDGATNLAEYQNGSDPTLDDIGPVVTAPADLVVPATGYFTTVDLGTASAIDGKDGAVTVASDWTFPVVRPGRYTVTWSARDAAGNPGTDTQNVDVLPMADFNVDQVTGEGRTVSVVVTLNGTPPQYPVTIPYTISGTAGPTDTDAVSGTFTINSGLSASLPVVIAADPPDNAIEDVTFTMTSASQATLGTRTRHRIEISELGFFPQVELTAFQNGLPRFVAYRSDGPFTVQALAVDPDGTPVVLYNWAVSNDALGLDAMTTATVSFDPSLVAPGTYIVSVQVGGNGGGRDRVMISVVDGSSADLDIDGDAVPDSVDTIVDYGALLPDQTGDLATTQLIETDPGFRLRRGETSIFAGRTGALIGMDDLVTRFGPIAANGQPTADTYDHSGGIFDFEIYGVARGDGGFIQNGSARIVLPLQTGIRPGSVYRKFLQFEGWRDFVVDQNNAVASAYSSFGECPGPDSDDYVDGLQPFADCVRLMIEDGGPNDLDGPNGVIRDPGGVAFTEPAAAPATKVSSGAWLALWLPLAALLRLRRRAGAVLLALVALGVVLPAQAQPGPDVRINYTGDAATGFDDNVTNAQHDADIRESGFASASGNVDYARALSLYTTLLLRGSGQYEYWNSFDGLNNLKATGMARLLYRGDGDFFTPTYAAWLSAAALEYDSDIRDGVEYRAGAFISENLTTQITGRFALGLNHREAAGRVFDLDGYSASLNFDWVPAPHMTVYTGFQYYNGGVASTATPSLWIGLAAEAIEADDAFGGLAGGLRAYRLDAQANILTLGYNYAFSRKLSADLQGQFIATRADAHNEYQRTIGVVSLLARF